MIQRLKFLEDMIDSWFVMKFMKNCIFITIALGISFKGLIRLAKKFSTI